MKFQSILALSTLIGGVFSIRLDHILKQNAQQSQTNEQKSTALVPHDALYIISQGGQVPFPQTNGNSYHCYWDQSGQLPTCYNSTYTGTYDLCTQETPCVDYFDETESVWYLSQDGTTQCPGSGVITISKSPNSICWVFAQQYTEANSVGYYNLVRSCEVSVCSINKTDGDTEVIETQKYFTDDGIQIQLEMGMSFEDQNIWHYCQGVASSSGFYIGTYQTCEGQDQTGQGYSRETLQTADGLEWYGRWGYQYPPGTNVPDSNNVWSFRLCDGQNGHCQVGQVSSPDVQILNQARSYSPYQ